MKNNGWIKLLIAAAVVAVIYWLATMLCDDTSAEAYYIGLMAAVLFAGWVMRKEW